MTDQGLHGQESEDIGGGADEEWQRFNILSLGHPIGTFILCPC